MELDSLYREYGQLIIEKEIAEARLRYLKQAIIDIINKTQEAAYQREEQVEVKI